ncbi:HepT-like ribonuclease domain-containing protein [Methanolacinia paynteri]|uniref:HepT-like ribonuclease domain-containing protein n=1 Tax=Methanolacinia paynteri TaxID=230356 RepID=UPI00064FED47|nr:DUF86 domain-containing protein [Methanolacinia paynteri]
MGRDHRDEAYLSHILEQCEVIMSVSGRITADEFLSDKIYQNAVIRSLEVIGEAAKQVSAEFRSTHPELPWREMAGTRDRLIHGYFSVNLEEVLDMMRKDIPDLYSQLREILSSGR